MGKGRDVVSHRPLAVWESQLAAVGGIEGGWQHCGGLGQENRDGMNETERK